MSIKDTLPERERRFVEEFLVDGHATSAYKRAGYKSKGKAACNNAARLMAKDRVQRAISEEMQARSERVQVVQDDVVKGLARIAFLDVRKLFTWSQDKASFVPSADITDDQAQAIRHLKSKTTTHVAKGGDTITETTLEISLFDKNKALENLGRHLGMFNDKLQLQGDEKEPMVIKTISARQV